MSALGWWWFNSWTKGLDLFWWQFWYHHLGLGCHSSYHLSFITDRANFYFGNFVELSWKFGWDRWGGISNVWGLIAGKWCTILGGPVKGSAETSCILSSSSSCNLFLLHSNRWCPTGQLQVTHLSEGVTWSLFQSSSLIWSRDSLTSLPDSGYQD